MFIGSLVTFSLIPLIKTIARVKPIPANNPYKTANPIFICEVAIPISEASFSIALYKVSFTFQRKTADTFR